MYNRGNEDQMHEVMNRLYAYDDRQPGLALSVTANNHRAFYFYRKIDGRPVRIKIGDFPSVTIEQARKQALKRIGEIAEGRDPVEERRTKRGEMTVGELRELYQVNHAQVRCSPRTIVSEDSLWTNSVKSLQARRLTALKPSDVAKHHARLARDKGQRTANRAIQYLGRLYRYAAKHHGYTGDIPTDRVDLFEEQSRERFLTADELPRFLAAVEAEPQPFRDLFLMLLYTGARSRNVRSMRWDDVNLKAETWTIPASESKSKRPMPIPLVSPAVEVLARRKAEQAEDPRPYVFPVMRKVGTTPYISSPQIQFQRVCKAADIKGLRIHDLRRSMGAWQAIGGASLLVIGRSLGHTDHRATQIYARLSDDPVRKSMEAAIKAMNQAGKEKGGKRKKKTK